MQVEKNESNCDSSAMALQSLHDVTHPSEEHQSSTEDVKVPPSAAGEHVLNKLQSLHHVRPEKPRGDRKTVSFSLPEPTHRHECNNEADCCGAETLSCSEGAAHTSIPSHTQALPSPLVADGPEVDAEQLSLEQACVQLKLEVAVARTELDESRLRDREMQRANENLHRKLNDLLAEHESMRREADETRNAMRRMEASAMDFAVERAALRAEMESTVNECELLKKELDAAREENGLLTTKSQEMETVLELCRTEAERLARGRDEMKDALDERQSSLMKARSENQLKKGADGKNNGLFGVFRRRSSTDEQPRSETDTEKSSWGSLFNRSCSMIDTPPMDSASSLRLGRRDSTKMIFGGEATMSGQSPPNRSDKSPQMEDMGVNSNESDRVSPSESNKPQLEEATHV